MTIKKRILAGLWFLILVNILLASGTVAILNRMAPAIANIIAENDNTLIACEDMLSVIALQHSHNLRPADTKFFFAAVKRAEDNITEKEERDILKKIREKAKAAFEQKTASVKEVIFSIKELTEINRRAMREADNRARRMGKAGAWGVVFLAGISLVCGIVFLNYLKKRVIEPICEILDVLNARKKGDHYRRCSVAEPSLAFNSIFEELNALLDRDMSGQ